MNKRIVIIPLTLYCLACSAVIGIVNLDTYLRDYGSAPLRMDANAIVVFDGFQTARISAVDVCSPSSPKIRPGWIAYQIWNWDHSWFSTKAFRKVVDRAMVAQVQAEQPKSK